MVVIGAAQDDIDAGFPGAQLHDFDEFVAQAERFAGDDVDVEAPLEIAIADRQIAQCLFSSGSTSDPERHHDLASDRLHLRALQCDHTQYSTPSTTAGDNNCPTGVPYCCVEYDRHTLFADGRPGPYARGL